jgi:pimeloyl-ACP methyl ester carboxylesterase
LRSPILAEWAARGTWHRLGDHQLFVADLEPLGPVEHPPLLVVHGFPTSSVDYRLVADALRRGRRVILPDMLGYGLSDKPDLRYTMALQADLLVALTTELGLTELSLLTHDMGDTVGGELLARHLEGRWPVEVTSRVVTNGSIYIESAHLTDGQLMLLSLPDERLGDGFPINEETLAVSLRATYTPGAPVEEAELAAACEAICVDQGQRLLPRLIRYIEERRANQSRFTGAIEAHGAPLTIVWGADDPIALALMSERLHATAAGSQLIVLDGVGHYPMVEAPTRFAEAVVPALR